MTANQESSCFIKSGFESASISQFLLIEHGKKLKSNYLPKSLLTKTTKMQTFLEFHVHFYCGQIHPMALPFNKAIDPQHVKQIYAEEYTFLASNL